MLDSVRSSKGGVLQRATVVAAGAGAAASHCGTGKRAIRRLHLRLFLGTGRLEIERYLPTRANIAPFQIVSRENQS